MHKPVILVFAIFMCATSAFPISESLPPIYFFDLAYLNDMDLGDPAQAREAWDTAHLVASLQGIVNREKPVLFVRFMPHPDDFWFDYLRQEGQWLAGRSVTPIASVEALLETFADRLQGMVTYDERVYATSNLASTIAGVEDRVCLRFDPAEGAIYRRTIESGLPFTKNELRLMREDGSPLFTGSGTIPDSNIPSSGSVKCDAYLWAKQRYLDAGRCSKEYMAYYLDAYWLRRTQAGSFSNTTLTNHDFFIAQRAFFFDLGVWEEETSVDDPGQPPGADGRTLRALLRAMYEQAGDRIIHIGGFTPWVWKYTDYDGAGGKHGGVDTEWKYAQIISAHNGIMDADALGLSGMANASFYQHYPLKDHYPQNPRPTFDTLKSRGLIREDGSVAPKAYVCFYMGDYDSAAWLNYHVPLWWADPAHGETLCPWAFNPNLDRRAPQALDYARTHQSPNDWFMFGDSGAGYLNPGMLVAPRADSGLPDGLNAWAAHNRPYAKRYDLSIVGFIIDGHSPGMGAKGMDAYMKFSPDGIVGQKIPPQGVHRGVMPYTRMKLDLDGSPEEAGARVAGLVGANLPKFLFLRTILKSPSWHRDTMAAATAITPDVEFIDPYSFFLLLKTYEARKDEEWTSSTPRTEVSFVAPESGNGLSPVSVDDGPFARIEIQGSAALYQPKPKRTQYLYFETSDEFNRTLRKAAGQSVEVRADVLDLAPGTLGIQYDSHRNSAYYAGPNVALAGSGVWIETVFALPDAFFGHCQNGGADFRLINDGNDLYVRQVSVRQIETPVQEERIKAFCIDFNWAPDGFAPPGMYAGASPKQHLEWYRNMGVNTIQTFCVSCPGYAWYRSEIAPVQPGMPGDFLKELADLGHNAGMRVMGYFCVGANTYWNETHPELSHNFPSSISIPFTTAYLDYLCSVMQEALTKTGIDGFMIDWVYNASHHYPDREYRWLECEKTMYQELFGAPFPGEEGMDAERINEFNRRATERCWQRIRAAAKSARPNCILWLSAYDLQHPMLKDSLMLKEVDWLMNEHPDPTKLDAVKAIAGPHTKLIQCICGWGDQHDAAKILADPRFAEIGMYGFARPDPNTALPPEDNSGNARNIAAMRDAFRLRN